MKSLVFILTFESVSVGIHISEDEDSTSVSQPLTKAALIKAPYEVTSTLARPIAPPSPQTEGLNSQQDRFKQLQDTVSH